MNSPMLVMSAALVGELVLLLLAVLMVAWFRQRARRRRDERAIRLLVTRVRNGRTERETAIGHFLEEQMGMSGEALEQTRTAILRAELTLLQRFASIYRRRDADMVARFDAELFAALAPYLELKAEGLVDETPADVSELEKLREQNRELSEELSANMETLSRMLRDFSTMFASSSRDAGQAGPAAAAPPASAEHAADQERAADVRSETGHSEDQPTAEEADDAEDPDLGTPESVDELFAVSAESGSAPDPDETGEVTPSEQDGTETEPAAEEGACPVDVEAGDDLATIAERLEEEGPAEVMAFDEPEEFDIELTMSDDPESDTEASATPTDTDHEADHEPLKAQSQG